MHLGSSKAVCGGPTNLLLVGYSMWAYSKMIWWRDAKAHLETDLLLVSY